MPWYFLEPVLLSPLQPEGSWLEDVTKAERPSAQDPFSNSNIPAELDVSLVASGCECQCVPSVGARIFHVFVTPRSETVDGTPSG
jgi:hypothetical protein